MYIICSDTGELRDELAKSPQKILASAFSQFYTQTEAVATQSSSVKDEALAGAISDSFTGQSSSNMVSGSDSYFNGLELVSALVKLIPEWLHNNRVVFDTLLLAWKSPARLARLQNEQDLSLPQVAGGTAILVLHFSCTSRCLSNLLVFSFALYLCISEQVMESKRLIKCFLNYLRHDRTEVSALFDMLSIFLYRSRIDYSFLKEFYVIEVMPSLVSNS
jgi:transformation/transcription domain-associated protein